MDASKLRQAYDLLKTSAYWKNDTNKWKGYAVANKVESQILDDYVDALASGEEPVAPVLTTAMGKGMLGVIESMRTKPPPPPPPPPPTTVSRNPIGWWRLPAAAPSAIKQYVSAVEDGAPRFIDGDKFAGVALGTEKFCYKLATECSAIMDQWKIDHPTQDDEFLIDYCNTFAPKYWVLKYHPDWLLKDAAGNYVRSFFGEGTGLVPNLGNVEYQNYCAQRLIRMKQAYGIDKFYFDNNHGFIKGLTWDKIFPFGYPTDRDWRLNAVLPWNRNVSAQVAPYNIKLVSNGGDVADPKLLEGDTQFNDGTVKKRYVAELAPFTNILDEYWLQRPTDGQPYTDQQNAWYAHWTQFGPELMAVVHAAGRGFYPLTYRNINTGDKAQVLAYATFLLYCRLDLGDTWMTWCDGPESGWGGTYLDGITNPFLTTPLGNHLSDAQFAGALIWRQFENKKVIVNKTVTVQTGNIAGKSYTLQPQTAILAT